MTDLKIFAVYYNIFATFRVNNMLTRAKVLNTDYFKHIGQMHVPDGDLDRVYTAYQSHNFTVQQSEGIRASGIGHASMSVGDVIYDISGDLMWQCSEAGWEPVTR